MSIIAQIGVVGASAALSLGSYYAGASLGAKFLPRNPESTQKSLALMGVGALVGNIAAKTLREYARQNCTSSTLNATCFGTFLGALLPMLVCIGGYDQKEDKNTSMVATAALISTLSFHLAALINPQDESLFRFVGQILFISNV